MEIRRIDERNKDFNFFEELNNEAFPAIERWDLKDALHYEIPADVMGLYENDQPVGFFIALSDNETVYLCYLAIAKKERNKGYGSRALHLIFDYYQGRQLCLDLEKQDDMASNASQRRHRKSFYLRNEMYETHYSMNFWDLSFELLCHDPSFNAEAFKRLCMRLTTQDIDPHIIWEGHHEHI